MDKQTEQALNMAIMDALVEFKMGTMTLQQALEEIKTAAKYYLSEPAE